MSLGGHSETEGGQKLPTYSTSDSCVGRVLLLIGECTRGKPAPWLAVKLGNGVQQGGYESLRGLLPCPPWSKCIDEMALNGSWWGLCALWAIYVTVHSLSLALVTHSPSSVSFWRVPEGNGLLGCNWSG